MKNHFIVFVMFLFLIFTNSVQSSTKQFSWNNIRSNKKFLIMQPQFAQNLGPDGLFNLCATADEFKSVRPVKICKKYAVIQQGQINSEQAEYSQMKCVKWKTEIVSLSRLKEKEEGIFRVSKKYQIDVVYSKGPRYMHHAFRKAYTVPDCF